MRIGLALPQYDYSLTGESPLSWESVLTYAATADASGFDSLWLSDHLFLDIGKYGGSPEPRAAFEPLVTLAALARTYPRLRIGTLVLCEALRPASVLAKALVTLDRISDGRLDVGVGAGWYEPEYEAIGMTLPSPGERIARIGEAVDVLRGMLDADADEHPVTVDGRFHRAFGATSLPPAVQRPATAGVHRRQGRSAAPTRRRASRRLEHLLGLDVRGSTGSDSTVLERGVRSRRSGSGDDLALARPLRPLRRRRA